ncbi:Protein of unknown function [Chryseobacterium arachidis]|uniref:DUF3606 domain-containing protein n=1 Tax=Chryseobacterium arachidis TaxID=1416778 RepID=A0A1M5I902_9FLAO|nr:DUF3606 domain-containing protein [Chryseobacterium arachidis]SHG24844.1 Protein of unknown function [Chryseobacterium arachidis]
MADNKSKKGKADRNKVSGSENYEIEYFKEKIGVSSQAVTGAIRARDQTTERHWRNI